MLETQRIQWFDNKDVTGLEGIRMRERRLEVYTDTW